MAEQTLLEELIAKIQQAKDEAIKRCILANAVAVSKDLYFSMFPTSGTPMICGLKAMPTVELPDNTAFAVFELPFLTSNTHTADVVEAKRGKWIYHECVSSFDGAISGYSCSECCAFVDEEIFDTDEFHKDFCGHCGADMRPLDKH